jgi:aryl sulfotransferase
VSTLVKTPRPERTHIYQHIAFDSGRLSQWRPRKGDIFVCTPPKTGTTWTQMACALLVHQSPHLPQPLTRLSRWLERHTEPVENVIAEFESQPFRRILKTHTPLDGLPYYEDTSYVFCGRDPRDAFLSAVDHFANLSEASLADAKRRGGIPDDFQFPTDPNVLFSMWLTTPTFPWVPDGFPMGSVLYYASSFWPYRRLPNILFLHYADLSDRLDEEMRRLSSFLGIPIDETVFPSLVRAASFEAMRGEGEANAPGAHLGEWRDASAFFKSARRGEWKSVLNAENLALYDRIATERLDPTLRRWLENGRTATGDPREI